MNKELEAFTYVSSHDLQEPLRKIQAFAIRILETENQHLSEKGKDYFNRMQTAASRMQKLIEDLLAFSRLNIAERKFENTDLNKIVEEVKTELKEIIEEKHATIEATELCEVNLIPFQFRQLMHNLISNALKFSKPEHPPHITIKSRIVKGSKLNEEKLLSEKNTATSGFLITASASTHNIKTASLKYFKDFTANKNMQAQASGLPSLKK